MNVVYLQIDALARRVMRHRGEMKRFAFTDESGNSGLKLFDNGQDSFWTGTLIAYADVDSRYLRFHKELLAITEKQELHGAELGFGGIEKIASRLSVLIREKNLAKDI